MIDRQTIDRRLAAIRNPDHILVCGDHRTLGPGPASIYIAQAEAMGAVTG